MLRDPVRVPLSDGAETVVERWGERGPLVVGVHGLGSSRRGWARIAEHLADRYRFVAYDQRGHGDSAVKGPMAFERSVADLADVVAAMGEPVGALIGHSWGGAVVVAGGRRLDARRITLDPIVALGEENAIDAGAWNLRELVRGYPKPLLLALADPRRSVVLGPERAEFRAHGGPNVRLDVFEGASHSLQRDAFDRFIPVLERFLTARPGVSRGSPAG